jgi:hypothetical protein
MATILADRALAVVRAPEIPDPVALANVAKVGSDSGVPVIMGPSRLPRSSSHWISVPLR